MFFTFGSLIRTSTLPKHVLQTFKDAFAKLPIRVLWKYEEEMPDKPDNVYISNWMPQRDILSMFFACNMPPPDLMANYMVLN